jgi:hypothetical protein
MDPKASHSHNVNGTRDLCLKFPLELAEHTVRSTCLIYLIVINLICCMIERFPHLQLEGTIATVCKQEKLFNIVL